MLQMDINDSEIVNHYKIKKWYPSTGSIKTSMYLYYLFYSITADQSNVCPIYILYITNFYLSLKPILIVIYVLCLGLE